MLAYMYVCIIAWESPHHCRAAHLSLFFCLGARVSVAVQLGPTRCKGEFSPDASLASILQHFQSLVWIAEYFPFQRRTNTKAKNRQGSED